MVRPSSLCISKQHDGLNGRRFICRPVVPLDVQTAILNRSLELLKDKGEYRRQLKKHENGLANLRRKQKKQQHGEFGTQHIETGSTEVTEGDEAFAPPKEEDFRWATAAVYGINEVTKVLENYIRKSMNKEYRPEEFDDDVRTPSH